MISSYSSIFSEACVQKEQKHSLHKPQKSLHQFPSESCKLSSSSYKDAACLTQNLLDKSTCQNVTNEKG